jgi:hypothetical protein
LERNVFTGKISPEGILYLNSTDYDKLYDGLYQKGSFYLLCEDGSNFDLLAIDEKMKASKVSLNQYKSEYSFILKEYENKILLTFLKGGKEIKCLLFDSELNQLEENLFTLDNTILDYDLILTPEPIFIVSTIKDSKGNLTLAKLESDGFFKILKTQELEIRPSIFGLSQDDKGVIKFSLFEERTGKTKRYSFRHYQMIEDYSELNDFFVLERNIFLNGKSLEKQYLSDNIPEYPYGNYQKLYRHHDKDLEYYLEDHYFFPVSTNIKNGEIYELGVCLAFNGIGYLNGTEIKSGTTVNEIGHYLLEIRSPEGFEAYVFEVAVLSEVEEEISEKIILEAGDITGKTISTEGGSFLELNLQENEENPDYVLPSILIGILLGSIFGKLMTKIGFRRKKNV